MSPHGLTFGEVALVNQARYHMAVVEVIVIVWTKDIGRDNASEHTVMLIMIGPAGKSIIVSLATTAIITNLFCTSIIRLA